MTEAHGGPVLGLIEGFYGRPWSWDERHRIVDFLAANGFDMYVYAPKDDPLHRARWREPLPQAELREFERLAGRCAEAGVDLVYGLSPIDLAHGDQAGVELLVSKSLQLRELGVDSFCLLFDDPPDDPPTGAAERTKAARWQASVANAMLAGVRSAAARGRFILCPTEYCGHGETPYRQSLGEMLQPGIEVFWTGRQVCSATITADDLAPIAQSLRRRPLIWDNYPVNDGEMRWDLHLRPLRGRAADLPAACRGIVANGAIGPESTRIALHTLAAYWRDPTRYDPEVAWGPALDAVTGDAADAAALRILGELARRSPIEPGDEPPVPWMEAFWARWELAGDDRAAALAEVESHMKRASAAAAHLLAGTADRPLLREIEPWALKLRAWVETVRSALGLLRGTSEPIETAIRLERTQAMPHRVADARFEEFARRCLARAGHSRLDFPR